VQKGEKPRNVTESHKSQMSQRSQRNYDKIEKLTEDLFTLQLQ